MEIRGCLCCEDFRLIFEDTPGGEERKSFHCCKGVVHIKTATLFVGLSALILSAFSTVCLFLGVYTVNFWLDVFLIIANTIVSCILLWGLYVDSPTMMIPFIVVEVAQCAGFFMLSCYVLYYTIKFDQPRLRKFDQLLMVISIYIGIIIAGTAVWAAAKCYHYLLDKQQQRQFLHSSTTSFDPFTPSTASTSLYSLSVPTPDYPYALGHSFPVSPFHPPTPPSTRRQSTPSVYRSPTVYTIQPGYEPAHNFPTSTWRESLYQSQKRVSFHSTQTFPIPSPFLLSIHPSPSPSITRSLYSPPLQEETSFIRNVSLPPPSSSSPIRVKRVYFPNSYTESQHRSNGSIPNVVPKHKPNGILKHRSDSHLQNFPVRNVRSNAFPARIETDLNEKRRIRDPLFRQNNCHSPYCNVPSSLTQSLYAPISPSIDLPSMAHSIHEYRRF